MKCVHVLLRSQLVSLSIGISCLFFSVAVLPLHVTATTTVSTQSDQPISVSPLAPSFDRTTDRLIRFSFDIENGGSALSGIRYGASLFDEALSHRIDEYVSLGELALASKASSHVSFEYEIPSGLSGRYRIGVFSETSSGFPLFTHLFPDVIVLDEKQGISIDPSTCFVSVGDDARSYRPVQGIDVSPNEPVFATCSIANHGPAMSVRPVLTVYQRSKLGSSVPLAMPDTPIFPLSSDSSTVVRFALPLPSVPQSYEIVGRFASDNGLISNAISFQIVVQGPSATFQAFSLDATKYQAGENAVARLVWSGRADVFPGSRRDTSENTQAPLVAHIVISSNDGDSCSQIVDIPLPGSGGEVFVPVPILKSCTDVRAVASISDESGILAEIEYYVPSDSTLFQSLVPWFVVLVLLVAILVILRRKYNRSSAVRTLLLFILSTTLLYPSISSAASKTITWSDRNNIGMVGTLTILDQFPQGSRVGFTGDFSRRYVACRNSSQNDFYFAYSISDTNTGETLVFDPPRKGDIIYRDVGELLPGNYVLHTSFVDGLDTIGDYRRYACVSALSAHYFPMSEADRCSDPVFSNIVLRGTHVGIPFKVMQADRVPIGAVDSYSCTGLSGWAYDPDTVLRAVSPTTPVPRQPSVPGFWTHPLGIEAICDIPSSHCTYPDERSLDAQCWFGSSQRFSLMCLPTSVIDPYHAVREGPAESYQCSNRIDDDGDGRVDMSDSGCVAYTDDSEQTSRYQIKWSGACSNGRDDDRDGKKDMSDPECSNLLDQDEMISGFQSFILGGDLSLLPENGFIEHVVRFIEPFILRRVSAQSSSITVRIYDGPMGSGSVIGSIDTSLTRPDINSQHGIVGLNGFSWTVPDRLKDGISRSLYVYAMNTNPSGQPTLLSGSPVILSCTGDVPSGGDVCLNLSGTQLSVPAGYTRDGSGTCLPDNGDYCPNIGGTQTSVPIGMTVNGSGQCVGSSYQCADGIDNDGDGLVDLADGGCANASDDTEDTDNPVCTVNCGTSTQCIDGIDNDVDGFVDMSDPGCSSVSDDDEANIGVPPTSDVCLNLSGTQLSVPAGYTRDGSGTCLPDNGDYCPNIGGTQTSVPIGMTVNGSGQCVGSSYQCADGIDNDGDGLVDLADGGCTGTDDDSESVIGCQGPQCGLGGNNGGNGGGGSNGNGNGNVSGFTVSGSPRLAIQFLANLEATSQIASLSVNPVSGFSLPVTLSVEGIRTATGDSLPAGVTPTYYFDGSPSSTILMNYNASFGQYTNPSGTIGTSFAVKLSKKITEKYYITVVGTSGSQRATFVIELNPNAVNPDFREI